MAKNFPYFKFIASEWLTGNIVFEEFDVQGIFTNVCALYWIKDGILSLEDLNKRYKNSELIIKLIQGGYIFIENGFVSIDFLNEQLQEANHISVVNSENGKKGAAAKALKIKESLAAAEPNLTTDERNLANKRKENKIKEEEKKNKIKEEFPENKFSVANEFRKIFEDFYFQKTNEKYYWTGKDAGKCKPLSNKLLFKIKEKNPAKKENYDMDIVDGFKYLLSIITDDWILSNLSFPIIDSKFNEIIAKKNGKQHIGTKAGQQHPLQRLNNLAKAINEHNGIKNA